MPASIAITGLSSSDPVPGVYPEINFAQGQAGGTGGAYEVLLMGNKTSTGTATVDTEIYGPDTDPPLANDADAIALFGERSELRRMYKDAVAIGGPGITVRAIAVTESAGAAATGTITFTNPATAQGTVKVYVCEEFVEYTFTSGDSITSIAAGVAAVINAKTHWPVTASASLGVVTLTAAQKGPRGNEIRIQASIKAGVGTTVSPTVDTQLTGGATADSNVTALSTILPKRYYYIASAANDATQLGALSTQVLSQSLPLTNIRQRVFAGSADTQSTANTLATGLNSPRVEIMWCRDSNIEPSRMAARYAAITALEEAPDNFRTNFAGYGNDAVTQTRWSFPAPRKKTSHPTRPNIYSALMNGCTPIGVNANGSTYIVDRATTRSLSGSNQDYRIRDPHKVAICDRWTDRAVFRIATEHAGKRIDDDPAPGQRARGANVLTPAPFRQTLMSVVDEFDANDLLQNVADIKARSVVGRNPANKKRMDARIPLQPIDNATQFGLAVDQVA